jgi:uncharacterized protein YerC
MEYTLIKKMRLEGKTLQEIAQHFGKSITWVYTRVNPKYAVKRRNVTSSDDTMLIDEPANKYEQMRKHGLTMQNIATLNGVSLTTVYKVLRNNKQKCSRERIFRDSVVIPYLQNILNHIQVVKEFTISFQRADIVSTTPDGKMCITEVKRTISAHAIQTSIGQLIIHQLEYPDAMLQIALPDRIIMPDTLKAHLEKYNIFTILINDTTEE